MSKVNLWLDQSIDWSHISTLELYGERRSYYLAPAPLRLLVVCRNSLLLGNLFNCVVDAAIGVDRADPGFARIPGEPQTKISIYRVVHTEWNDRLSRVLRHCYRD